MITKLGSTLVAALAITLSLAGCGSETDTMPEPTPKTYVLVHGAWMGAWAWDEVAKDLKADGADVVVVDLPAHGDDTTAVKDASLGAYADKVAAAIGEEGEPVILVGHSMAGMVISRVAEEHPDRIAKLVYLGAYLPTDGQSLFDLASTDADSKIGAHLTQNEDGTASIDEAALGEVFCADCDADGIKALQDHYRDEPVAPLAEPVTLTAAAYGKVTKVYIRTEKDAAVSPALQSKMLTAQPVGEELTLATAHTPLLSAPADLAALLGDL